MKNYFKRNFLTVFFLVGTVILYFCIPAQIAENMVAKSAISPRFFPTFSIVCIMICCVLLLLIDAMNHIKTRRKGDAPPAPAAKDSNVSYWRVVGVVVLLFAWLFLLKKVGFIISMTVLLFVLTYILGTRNKIVLIIMPVGFTLVVYYVFSQLLHVNLPEILF